MDPRELETLVQRLVANPHDQEALAYAHQAGASDPQSYADMLERVGQATEDPAIASHWLTQAANVWSVSLDEPHRAAQILMAALERDPTAETAADTLAQLYRDRNEVKGLLALLERRTKALGPYVAQDAAIAQQVAAMHEELGRLWAQSLSQPRKGIENFRRAIELDPTNVYALYGARELYKQAQQYADAIALFDMEQQLVEDPERKVALYRDEAQVRSEAGDKAGASQVLRNARMFAPEDIALVVELASMIVDRVKAGEPVAAEECEEAGALFVHLAESYPGEHGLAYSLAALDALPGHDRAMQLADYFGRELGRVEELPTRWQAYLAANPAGALYNEAQQALAELGSIAQQPPAAEPSGSARASVAPPAPQPSAPIAEADDFAEAEPEPEPEPVSSPAANPEQIAKLLAAASEAASKGNKALAFTKYKEALALDAGNVEAVLWVKDHLRQKRLYPDLRDVLSAGARAMPAGEDKKQVLRELAGLCEQQLRDVDGAIQAFKQLATLDRGDASVGESLRRLLEKSSRWDELASVLEEEAMGAIDQEEKLALEKKLAQLHETKRKDVIAAAEAWARIATITPDDDQAIWTSVKLFEKGDRDDLAGQVISDVAGSVEDPVARGGLLVKLGELRAKNGDHGGAGEAYAEAAGVTENSKTWELAEQSFVAAERWKEAAGAVEACAELAAGDPKLQASLYAKSADFFAKAGDDETAGIRLEQAVDLDPTNDAYGVALEQSLEARDRVDELPGLLLKRADAIADREIRVGLRVRAASIQREKLDNMEAARETLLKILEDGDDVGALSILVDDAVDRGEFNEAASLLKRLSAAADTREKKLDARLREAEFLAERLEDLDAAADCYGSVLAELDDKNIVALSALVDIEERRDNPGAAVSLLERKLALVEGEEKIELARRLVELYIGPLDDERGAIRAFEAIVAADEEDFEAIAKLCELTERAEDWERTSELLRKQIEVEGDEEEIARLSNKLAEILADKLGRAEEALAALATPADEGDVACQQAYAELGDRLNLAGQVADKLVQWNESRGASVERNMALRGAFDRFVAVGRDADAARVAMTLARTKAADKELADALEQIGVRLKDLDALQTAHDLLAKELSGALRAEELVRQAEMLFKAGVAPAEALQHGEAGLTSVPAAEVEPLLQRLASLAPSSSEAIDLYERQVSRAKLPADRLKALARAAQIAAGHGANDRARSFFELALAGNIQEDALAALEEVARSSGGDNELLKTLAEAFASGGQGSRDGGRTRSTLLRRAANIAHRDLNDIERAFGWFGDSLIAYVDQAALDALEDLGAELGSIARVEATLSRALGEVFDGPLVRQLLARRAQIRRAHLDDKQGAAQDLKKLHDLAPSDQQVMEDLAALLTELGDYRGMVQVLEDQILRGKDPAVRAELARKVAVLWEERLGDAREAADAWRRVLRMKAGDSDAQAGLERAKTNQLRKAADAGPAPAPKPAPKPVEAPPVVEAAAVAAEAAVIEPEPEAEPVEESAPAPAVEESEVAPSFTEEPAAAEAIEDTAAELTPEAAPVAPSELIAETLEAPAVAEEEAIEEPVEGAFAESFTETEPVEELAEPAAPIAAETPAFDPFAPESPEAFDAEPTNSESEGTAAEALQALLASDALQKASVAEELTASVLEDDFESVDEEEIESVDDAELIEEIEDDETLMLASRFS